MFQRWILKINTYLLKEKPKFRVWCKLEDLKYEVIQAVEDSTPNFPKFLCDYLSTAFLLPVNYEKVYWKDTISAFYSLHDVTSSIRKIPITDTQEKSKGDKDPWDYAGRLWPLYLNIIASTYGWDEKRIASLSVDDALAYIQEILTDKHLEKEFIWQTSEIAYPYDKATKKSKFSPLSRPYWMEKKHATRKAPPIPKSLLPVGNIVRLKDQNETTKPKATELGANVESLSAPETRT